jgi:2-polyprenyl-3-methyl-5-hydroxy-6-metoxy-1,4-benzoquinol methylase
MVDKTQYIKLDNGSYKSKGFSEPSSIYLDNYWSHEKNRSTIDEQVTNVLDKNELVKLYITDIEPKKILEIACTPAILLGELSYRYDTVGIEVDSSNLDNLIKYSPLSDFHFGFFPEITKNWESESFSNIIALDVIEHVEDGISFLKECNRLLVKNGVLIIQAPITLEDGVEPDEMFHVLEHIWIYSIEHLTSLLKDSNFNVKNVSRWKVGHEQIVAIKK